MANLTWRQVKWHVNYTNVKSQNSGFNYGKKVSLSDYKIDAKLGNRVRFGHLKTSKQAVAIKMFQKDAIQDDNLQYILIEKRVRSSLEVYQRHFCFRFYSPVLINTFRNYLQHSKPKITFIWFKTLFLAEIYSTTWLKSETLIMIRVLQATLYSNFLEFTNS